HAGRLEILRDAVITPGAFVGNALFLVEIASPVGTGLHAISAADAILVIDQDHTVLGPVGGAGGADLNAGRMGAVVAKLRNEESLFHLRILVPIGKPVLLLR